MALKSFKKGNTGRRYSDRQKKIILAFVQKRGRGGITAAGKKYGVSYIALKRWMNNGSAGKFSKVKTVQVHSFDKRKLRPVKSVVKSLKTIQRQVNQLHKQLSKVLR